MEGSEDLDDGRSGSPRATASPSPPPVPLQTYLWEDVKREKQRGEYPWTHFVKKPFDPNAPPEILQYDRSPGSKRKYGSLDVQELDESPSASRRRRAASVGESLGADARPNGDTKTRSKSVSIEEREPSTSAHVSKPLQAPSSPRSILKNRPQNLDIPSGASHVNGADRDSPKDTECCHPFVDKLKTIADKNILKSPRAMKKLLRPSPKPIKKQGGSLQEIIPLDDSPAAERRKRDLEKVTFEKCSPALPKRQDSKKYKDHIYESIEDLPAKILSESPTEKELQAISKSLHDADQVGTDRGLCDSDDFTTRDSLTRSLDQYLKEELVGIADDGMDSKNQILKDILRRIADESEKGADAQAPLSKMDSEEDDTQRTAMKQMPVLKEDDVESSKGSKTNSVDKCLVIDVTETVEEEIVDFVVLPDEDQDLGDESTEMISQENSEAKEREVDETIESKTVESAQETSSQRKLKEAKSDTKGRWSTFSDHEYESIGDPDSETGQKSTDQRVGEEPKTLRRQSDVSSTTSAERKQLQAASSFDTEHSPAEENVDSDREMTVQEMQKQIEDKYFNKPEDKPKTELETAGTSDNKKSPVEVQQAATPRTAGQRSREMQEKFKAQAGRLKTKFKGMKKPSFSMPERKKPRISDETESSVKSKTSHMPKLSMPEFKLPDRPKITMPDFKMPDRPKMSMPHFKMPDKFKMSDKSKFKMPERPHMPDFKMPERPKMPEFKLPEFKMPERPKMPEFKMPSLKRHNSLKEHTSSGSTAESKKHIALDFRTYPRIFSKKSRDEEYVTSSPKDERTPVDSATVPRAAARKKGPVGARWVNRFSDIKFADDGLTEPKRGDFEDRLHRLDEDYKQMQQEQEYDDELEGEASLEQPMGESFDRGGESMASEEYSGQPNRYWAEEADDDQMQNREYNYGVPVDGRETPLSTQEERGSSGESYERHRKGVLDEFDRDEYYLREKGISEDDIQVGKYLSSEIRDAFKTPVNALEQLGVYNGYEDRELDLNDYSASRDICADDDIDMDVSLTPLKPERTRSLRKQRLLDDAIQRDDSFDEFTKSNEAINGFNTFPPNRPRRKKKTKKAQQNLENVPPYNVDVDFNDENDRNIMNIHDVDNFDRLMYENEMMEGKDQPDILVMGAKFSDETNRALYENDEQFVSHMRTSLNAYESEENLKNLQADREPPRAPRRKRKRSTRDASASSEPGSMINAQFHDDWPSLTQLPPDMDDDIIVHRVQHEYVIPLAESEHFPSPTPPRRTRSRSLVSRTTTAPDEDRTSDGAEPLAFDSQPALAGDSTRNILDMFDGSGYAVVKRQPSVPKRRKRVSKSAENRPIFHTTPRRADVPPRPPRRGQSESDLRDASPDVTQYEEVEDDMRFEELQTGEVVSKMKDRPLPAPPRPPRAAKRKKRKGIVKDFLDDRKQDESFENVDRLRYVEDEDKDLSFEHMNIIDRDRDYGSTENLEEELLEHALIRDIAAQVVYDVIQNAELHVEQRNEMYSVEETEMWTQTDPIADDFVCEDVEDESDVKFLKPSISKESWRESITLPDDASLSTLERNKDDSKRDKLRKESSQSPKIGDDSRLDPLDIERARRIADAESLSRGIRRFRETSRQRTFSSSRTPSERAVSEKALLLERTIVTPTKLEETEQLLTQATLLVRPVDDDIDVEDILEEQAREDRRHIAETVRPHEDHSETVEGTEMVPEQEPPIPKKRRGSLKKKVAPVETSDLPPAVTTSPDVVTRIIERRVEVPVAPSADTEVAVLKTNRLQVSNLDVENLNVSQLQASSIKVSEVDGVALQVKELNSKSGNLVVSGIDIAPQVLQDIIDKLTPASVHTSSQMSTQTDEPYVEPSQEKTESVPERPPPPPTSQPSPDPLFSQHPYMQQGLYYPYPASIPPPSFYALRSRDYSEDEMQEVQQSPLRTSRRRHVPKRESTSEEEHRLRTGSMSRYRRPGTKSPEPSVREISGQLVRACCNSVQRSIGKAWSAVQKISSSEERKREIQIALIILLVFTAGLILIGLSDNKTVHHHHWEFFNPSPDKNA